ncbi:MAG TPA: SRPBCC domain-containing protein [Candidatus Angelobacter sp.]|jgi:uncharacterized protein YndB with AHSA1/START domain|nr:SRPBCC domain-containing protein [Candidatus Angelobacter sp.]
MAGFEMVFMVDVNADRAKVRDALTTEQGINGWWTDRASVPSAVGSTLEFTFPGMPRPFDFTLAESSADRVEWVSKGFPPPWAGTRVVWTLEDNPEGPGTRIHMRHVDWTPDNPILGMVTVGWGQMFANLKGYVETGRPQPFFVN